MLPARRTRSMLPPSYDIKYIIHANNYYGCGCQAGGLRPGAQSACCLHRIKYDIICHMILIIRTGREHISDVTRRTDSILNEMEHDFCGKLSGLSNICHGRRQVEGNHREGRDFEKSERFQQTEKHQLLVDGHRSGSAESDVAISSSPRT